jgi:hypothetical protein
LSRNVGKQPTPRNIPEQLNPQLHRGGTRNLKGRMFRRNVEDPLPNLRSVMSQKNEVLKHSAVKNSGLVCRHFGLCCFSERCDLSFLSLCLCDRETERGCTPVNKPTVPLCHSAAPILTTILTYRPQCTAGHQTLHLHARTHFIITGLL